MSTARGILALTLGALVACAPREPLAPASTSDDPEVAERLILDVRDPAEFAAGHHPGALNIQLSWRQLGPRLPSYVPDRETPLAIHAADRDQGERAAAVLAGLGYRDVVEAPALSGVDATMPLLSIEELRAQLSGPQAPIVIDIRSAGEFASGTIDGALLVDENGGPVAVAELDPTREYAVICELGWRSSQLASWMRRNGFDNVKNVIDGMSGWRDAEAPVTRPPAGKD